VFEKLRTGLNNLINKITTTELKAEKLGKTTTHTGGIQTKSSRE